jgi:nitrogen fixation NifU-like protein
MMDDLRELYQEVILDHGRSPRNFRRPEDCNREARGDNPLCGDRFTVYLTVNGDGTITDAAFEGRGCAISTASASMMTDMVRGKSAEAARALFKTFHEMCTEAEAGPIDGALADDMDKLQVLSGVRQYPMRVKCATLAWHAMNAAMQGEEEATTE